MPSAANAAPEQPKANDQAFNLECRDAEQGFQAAVAAPEKGDAKEAP